MEIQKGFDPAPVAITNRNASALNFTSPSLPMLQAQVSLNLDNEVNEFQVSEYLFTMLSCVFEAFLIKTNVE